MGAVAVLAAMAVLSACLGPDEFDPTGTAPVGHLDLAVADGASIRVVGWALDPDTGRSIEIKVAVQGETSTYTANLWREDVAAVYPRHGAYHGFEIRTRALPPGVNQVCVWIPNVINGTQDRSLGCQDVVTGSDDVVGSFEAFTSPGPTSVRATGWAYDAEATGPISLIATLDGVRQPDPTTNTSRPELNAWFHRGGNFGFQLDYPASLGRHELCLYAFNVGLGADRWLGCRQVWVNSTPTFGPGAGISSSQPVSVPAGHPLSGIDRDGGVSTQLRDGSVLWLFGDSSQPLAGGGVRYFVNNTAAWAHPGEPTVTRDAVAPGDVPYTFVSPAAAFTTPCPAGFSAVMWPLSATSVPDGASNRDRVIAFFGNVCLNGHDARSRGVSVVEWIYDPAAYATVQSVGPRLQGRVLRQNLFPVGAEYGTASFVEGGYLYAYECGRPSDDFTGVIWPDDPAFTGCTVARVDPAFVDVPGAWTYWVGGNTASPGSWSANASAAATMSIPGSPSGDKQLPVSTLSVSKDPTTGYTMTYSPWPGFTAEVYVRTAPSLAGPWSARTLITLPGCNDWAEGEGKLCYAATAQPWRSQPGQLGIGYYDQYVAQDPVRGVYFSANAPFVP